MKLFLTIVIFMVVSFLLVALKYQTRSYFRLPAVLRAAASILHAAIVAANILLFFLLCDVDYQSLDLPAVLRIAGAALALGGIAFILAGAAALRARLFFPSREDRLLAAGLFRLVRNPMYLGGLAGALGISLAASSRFGLIYTAVFAVVLYVVARLEERDLEVRFGPEFSEYRRLTPLLLPTPGSLRRFVAGWLTREDKRRAR